MGLTRDVSDFDNETLFFMLDTDEDGRIGMEDLVGFFEKHRKL